MDIMIKDKINPSNIEYSITDVDKYYQKSIECFLFGDNINKEISELHTMLKNYFISSFDVCDRIANDKLNGFIEEDNGIKYFMDIINYRLVNDINVFNLKYLKDNDISISNNKRDIDSYIELRDKIITYINLLSNKYEQEKEDLYFNEQFNTLKSFYMINNGVSDMIKHEVINGNFNNSQTLYYMLEDYRKIFKK